MKKLIFSAAVLMILIAPLKAQRPEFVMSESGAEGGLVVYLGPADGKSLVSLKPDDRFFVHCLDTDINRVEKSLYFLASCCNYKCLYWFLF